MPQLSHRRRGAEAEIPVFFDEWDKPPVPALYARVRQAAGAAGTPDAGSLISDLREWQETLDVTFIILVDRFEKYLAGPADRAGFAEFEETLVQIANDPTLRVNFLLALDERAEPLLARLRRHIPRLGNSRIRVLRTSHADEARFAEPQAAPRPDRAADAVRSDVREERASRAEGAPPLPLHVAPVAPAAASNTPEHAEPVRNIESPVVARALQPEEKHRAPGAAAAVAAPNSMPAPTRKPPVRQGPSATRKSWFARLGWAPVLLIPAGWFLFGQPNLIDRQPGDKSAPPQKVETAKDAPVAPAPRADKTTVAAQSVPSSAPAEPAASRAASAPAAPRAEVDSRKTAPPSPPQRVEAPPAKAAPPSPPQRVEAPPAKAAPPSPPQRVEAPPAKAAPPTPPPAAEIAPAKPPPPAVKPPVARPVTPPTPPPQAAAKPPSTAPIPAQRPAEPQAVAKAAPPAPAPPAPERSPQPEAVAKAAPVPPPAAPRPSSATPAGPVVHILVRNEAQRARAERLVAPLRERGIHVAGIRVAPPSADAAHVRYYRSTDRNEAMRVAVALREVGMSAQQLRQMPESSMPAGGRTYELWLPSIER